MEITDSPDVLAVVRVEHDALRARLDRIEHGLVRAADGSGQAFVETRNHFRSLLAAFLRHLEHEETVLRPLLTNRQAWGSLCLDELRIGHAEQRRLIAELDALDEDTPSAEWTYRMRSFVAALRADMANEEHDFVHPNSLEVT